MAGKRGGREVVRFSWQRLKLVAYITDVASTDFDGFVWYVHAHRS